MRMNIRLIFLLALALALAGCTMSARLYPVNEMAASTGVLVAKYKSYGTQHGEMSVALPSGEVLNGEYSVVSGGSVGFGSVYGQVYGQGQVATGYATSNSFSMSGSGQGMASLFGDKGSVMTCEFINNNFSGHGHGGCQTSTGALYRVIY